MSERRISWQTWLGATFAGGVAIVALLLMVWLAGYISRVKVRVPSPDGRIEAVCRAMLPESTEYDLWLRKWWQPFGTHVAHSGTESMGRCRDVVWSPDGMLVLIVNEGNSLVIIDAVSRRRLAVAGRFAPGETWNYASARIITSLRFTSAEELAFEHCDRLPVSRGTAGDFSHCGRDVRHGRARLVRTHSRVSVTVIPNG
jgi:hypothetical protein